MLKRGRVNKVKVLFLVVVFVFHFDLFKFSAAILEKGLLNKPGYYIQYKLTTVSACIRTVFFQKSFQLRIVLNVRIITEHLEFVTGPSVHA